MFHDRTISSLYEKYVSEQIDCGDVAELEELPTPAPMVAVLDKQVSSNLSKKRLSVKFS